MLELLFNKVTGMEVYNFIKKGLQQRCFLVNIAKFLRALFWRTSENDCFCTSNHKISNKYWASLLNQKHDLGWPLLGRFVDLVRVCSLLIISRNHSNMFLFLDLQKNRNKVKNCSQDYLFWYHDFDRFRQVDVHYLMPILMICN